MYIRVFQPFAALLWVLPILFFSISTVFSPPCQASGIPGELQHLITEAHSEHPRIAEAKARADRAVARYRETYAFLDPSLRLAGGVSDVFRGMPGFDMQGSLSSEAFEVQGSLEIPVRPGFYLSAGLLQRYYHNPENYQALYQSTAGAGIRIPLLRDRGFAGWSAQRRQLLAELDRALSDYLAQRQSLRRDVEHAYIAVIESLALRVISQQATGRFESLRDEAQILAAHHAIAEYQTLAAETELALGRADDLMARQAIATAHVALMELTAASERSDMKVMYHGTNWLFHALELVVPEMDHHIDVMMNRGDYLVAVNERLALDYLEERERQTLQADLSLQAGATWRVEDENEIFSQASLDETDTFGGHVMLVYKRPLGFRGERSRVNQLQAQKDELNARLQRLELTIQRDLKMNQIRFDFARKRLFEITRAVNAATKNLAAEEERFRLGESRSRNVLDAQKDLTKAEQARVVAAAGVLRAWSDYRYTAGYPVDGDDERSEDVPTNVANDAILY